MPKWIGGVCPNLVGTLNVVLAGPLWQSVQAVDVPSEPRAQNSDK